MALQGSGATCLCFFFTDGVRSIGLREGFHSVIVGIPALTAKANCTSTPPVRGAEKAVDTGGQNSRFQVALYHGFVFVLSVLRRNATSVKWALHGFKRPCRRMFPLDVVQLTWLVGSICRGAEVTLLMLPLALLTRLEFQASEC